MKISTLGLMISLTALTACSKPVPIYKPICDNPQIARPFVDCSSFRSCKESVFRLMNWGIQYEGITERCTTAPQK